MESCPSDGAFPGGGLTPLRSVHAEFAFSPPETQVWIARHVLARWEFVRGDEEREQFFGAPSDGHDELAVPVPPDVDFDRKIDDRNIPSCESGGGVSRGHLRSTRGQVI